MENNLKQSVENKEVATDFKKRLNSELALLLSTLVISGGVTIGKAEAINKTVPEATKINLPASNMEAKKFSFPTQSEKKELESLIQESVANPEILDKIVLKVVLSEHMVVINYDGNDIIRFPVAIGKKGWQTPIGNWVVESLVEDPTNTTEITPNKLITANWIGFASIKLPSGDYFKLGFHGTPLLNTLGTDVSNGCVRMNPGDIRKLAKLVKIQINYTDGSQKKGTPVIITE